MDLSPEEKALAIRLLQAHIRRCGGSENMSTQAIAKAGVLAVSVAVKRVKARQRSAAVN